MPAIITITDDEKVIVIYGVDAARAVVDDGLVELALLISEGETDLAAQIVAGQETIAGSLAAAEDAAEAAAASAAEVAGAIDVFIQSRDIEVDDDDGLDPGGWYFERNTPYDLRVSRFIGQVIGGTGTVNVSVVDGSDVVYGPVTLSTTQTANGGLGFLIPAGSDPSFYFEDVTGSVTAVYAKVEGLPE